MPGVLDIDLLRTGELCPKCQADRVYRRTSRQHSAHIPDDAILPGCFQGCLTFWIPLPVVLPIHLYRLWRWRECHACLHTWTKLSG